MDPVDNPDRGKIRDPFSQRRITFTGVEIIVSKSFYYVSYNLNKFIDVTNQRDDSYPPFYGTVPHFSHW